MKQKIRLAIKAITGEDWQTITCRTYSYLNDLAQGVGDVADASAARTKLEDFINGYRAAYKQGSNNFTFSSTNFGDVYPTDYTIKGVSSIKVGLARGRRSGTGILDTLVIVISGGSLKPPQSLSQRTLSQTKREL